MDQNKHDLDKLKKMMTHPVFVTHDTNAKVIRAQLFFLSTSLIFISTSSITISDKSSVLGIGIEGLELNNLLLLLSIVIAYQLVHFTWASWESFLEWRVRLTALDTGGFGGGGLRISAEDEATKVRQTTLYAYVVKILPQSLSSDDKEKITSELEKCLISERVHESLVRFDLYYKMFWKSQNIRWLILEFGLPLLLGVCSLGLAANKYGLFCWFSAT